MPRPSPAHLNARLKQLITTSPPTTALFYARIWYKLYSRTELEPHAALHTLALALLQDGQPYSAIDLVRDFADDSRDERGWKLCGGCAMILAKCCEEVGRFGEGQAVLAKAVAKGANLSIPVLSPTSSPANSSLLLAKLSHKGKVPETAIDQYTKALQEDPWLWEAYTGLCAIGSPPSLEATFPDPPSQPKSAISRNSRHQTLSPNPMPRSSASEVPGFMPRKQNPIANGSGNGFFTPDIAGATARLGMMGNPSWDTPSTVGDNTFSSISETHALPIPTLPPQTRRPFPGLMSAISSASAMIPSGFRSSPSSSSSSSTVVPGSIQTPVNGISGNGMIGAEPPKLPGMKRPRGHSRRPIEITAPPPRAHGLELKPGGREMKGIEPNGETSEPPRRSTRLKSTTSTSSSKSTSLVPNGNVSSNRDIKRGTRSRSATSSTSGATAMDGITSPPPPPPISQDVILQAQADDWLRHIVRRCGRAYRALSLFSCKEALREIDALPVEIQNSAWALDIVARSFYEMANYVLAKRAFKSLFEIEPYRLESSELYSTLLWHLGDAPNLSHLSQHLMSINRDTSPQAWIASGNLFSLQKDHEEAIKCFKRATVIDPGCAYAWTLGGYEAVEMEEYDRALGMYRTALRTDFRHYNAWYGIGLVYSKMGKTKYAEHHFRRAAEINPSNAVLLCCIGMVLEQTDDMKGALRYYEDACRYAPESPMVLFKRIRMLVALQRIDEAISALVPLARSAPDEAQVFFLLGKCYLRKGLRAEAMPCLETARELQPKLEGAIKSTIEANGEEVDDDEDDD